MKIFVQNKDLGFFTQNPITVQRYNIFEPDFPIWCNHAQAEPVAQERVIFNPDTSDIVWSEQVYHCKCGAYRLEYDTEWQDAPFEGLHDER